ncbi:hypothetical protein BZA77DRAFT_324289 [Pyronema omphalodes]|nr:hypothetical protein BZA77DRAFT_324289 [Pyronema omphalodes]
MPKIHYPASEGNGTESASTAKLRVIGTFIDAPSCDVLRIRENTIITVDVKSGLIESIGEVLDDEGSRAARVDNGVMAYVPGFVDCHIHAAQFLQLGTKTDIPLMEWLNKYTFPAESAFSDDTHATKVYEGVVRSTLRTGTTTACFFGSNYTSSTTILGQLCHHYGQRALIGKVCSDQLVPDNYIETTDQSVEDTKRFIESFEAIPGDLVKPIITPRFVPTCSKDLLDKLGELAEIHDCHVQTHAAESVEQVNLVASLNPDLKRDIPILNASNLLRGTGKTILAHCTHLLDAELKFISDKASVIACPLSNLLFARAIVPVKRYMKHGVQVALGTDVAGGWSSSMLDSIRMATVASSVHGMQPPVDRSVNPEDHVLQETSQEEERFGFVTAFHLGTAAGGKALGLNTGAFEKGMKWDALKVELMDDEEMERLPMMKMDWKDLVERWICQGGGEHGIREVWVDGKLVMERR